MQIWLINAYGPIPGEGWRDYRFTMLSEALAERGHHVTWWTSNFSHQFKRFRSQGWADIAVAPNFEIRLVPTPAYHRNIGLKRAWFEAVFAWRVWRRANWLWFGLQCVLQLPAWYSTVERMRNSGDT